MEFALNRNNERIHAADANKQDEYVCPLCHKKVVLRSGEVNADHFAHQSKGDDPWKYDTVISNVSAPLIIRAILRNYWSGSRSTNFDKQ